MRYTFCYLEGISGNITLSISDHLAQFLIIPLDYQIHIQKHDKYRRDTANLNKEEFILDLLEIDWKKILKIENNDPNFSFNEFERKLNSIIDKHMPMKKLTKKEINHQHKPWITPGIKKSIKRRDALYKKFIKIKNPIIKGEYHAKYKELRNVIVNLCRNSKKAYHHDYFVRNANNLRNTWKGIKTLIELKNCVKSDPCSLMVEDELINDPTKIANEFNDYFSSVASNLRNKAFDHNTDFKSYLQNRNENNFFINPTSKEEVVEIINGETKLAAVIIATVEDP